MKYHYTESYLLNPTHQITVNLIGCGGTGTQVLSGLARLNEALLALNHPGLFVTVWDDDMVSPANVGRQLFSPADIGQNKAVLSVTRVNRFFGYEWQAQPRKFSAKYVKHNTPGTSANITITCVDSAKARIEIAKILKPLRSREPDERQYYWMDYGNLQKTGQVVLGTIGEIYQHKEKGAEGHSGKNSKYREGVEWELKNVVQLLPQIKKVREKNQGPSCSLAEALNKQDLFINSTLANLGLNLLWKLFREARISYHGCYLNLDTMSVNPIKIQA